MSKKARKQEPGKKGQAKLFNLLRPYKGMIVLLIVFTLLGNGTNLVIPKIIAKGIDAYSHGHFILDTMLTEFLAAVLVIFVFSYLQSIVQTYASEKVAFDLRNKLSEKISRQSYAFIQKSNPSRLLTNLTSDMDSVKMFVAQAVSSIVSSLFMIIGISVLLITIDWKLAIPVIMIIPIIGIVFFIVLKKVRVLFKRSREVVDWLNKIINESILGAAIIRVINSQMQEYRKFIVASSEAKNIGISILTLFATLIPTITFVASLALLTILALGGHFVIQGSLTLGNFTAFNSYVALLIFPIIMIGFMSNIIARASASYERIDKVMTAKETIDNGTLDVPLKGNIELKNVSFSFHGKPVLKSVSFSIQSGTRTAIIGPTAAGKSQLLYLLTGLNHTEAGELLFDSVPIEEYNKEFFHNQIGFVFQDSVMFNISLRENIAFSDQVTDQSLEKALETSGLTGFVNTLPEKLDTVTSERGTNLSGGQKQRIMLARALALNPKILLLDDFTARVDQKTEQKILRKVEKNYQGITLISVTQKIEPIKDFDQIVLLMEGEVVAVGKHDELLKSCPEYIQIYNSQLSTNQYELQS
ncbi:MAG: ABC transporter ATP-binding protein [Bacteroidales bacterium]|nr:ABC transporter ATP-binding protein [Bacteroidales bacterium]